MQEPVPPDVSPQQLRAHAQALREQAEQLLRQAASLFQQAHELERARDAARLAVGMVVYPRTVPADWLHSGALPLTTKLRIERLGPKNAVVSRVDGQEFPFPAGSTTQALFPRTSLIPA